MYTFSVRFINKFNYIDYTVIWYKKELKLKLTKLKKK